MPTLDSRGVGVDVLALSEDKNGLGPTWLDAAEVAFDDRAVAAVAGLSGKSAGTLGAIKQTMYAAAVRVLREGAGS